MKVLVLDLETTVQKIEDKTDNSPFNPDNRCVSAHFGWLGVTTVNVVETLVFGHNEMIKPDSRETLEEALAEADVMVAHNAKFDINWLTEMGFTIPPVVRCTMIGEYILAKGQRQQLSLKATAERRDVTRKKSDLVDDLFKSGTGFEAMPLATVIEYAEADVIACGEIYLAQEVDFAQEHNQSLTTIVDLMNEMLMFLVEIECNGTYIDLDVLAVVEAEFVAEKAELETALREIIDDVMGDTPINLNSGADMTKVVYSRSVNNRHLHQQVWNIGLNADGRPLYPPRMSAAEFARAVRSTTTVMQRTMAVSCPDCEGQGSTQKFKSITRTKQGKKYKVVGDPYVKRSRCKVCAGVGALYQPTGVTAGLKLNPAGPSDASINGFKTDKVTLGKLMSQAKAKGNLQAQIFLTKSSRLNAVSTYLDSFVKGVQMWTRSDGLLHSNFNQCVTATGRLSSSNPNLQNQPKRGFPVRKSIVSRFKDGFIMEADYSGLEFRVAGELSQDPQIILDIKNGKDVHKQTASIINQRLPETISKDERQGAKAYTFAPLYGGTGAGEPPHITKYFSEFFEIYSGLKDYQKELMEGVIATGIVQTPSGRQYYWPNARRTRNGKVSHATQVVNYPVQGFATGDIVPLACIRAQRIMKPLKLRSKLILTVHDSIVVDTAPDEVEQVKAVLKEAMADIGEELVTRWDYTPVLPLDIEISIGKNWLEQNEISVD